MSDVAEIKAGSWAVFQSPGISRGYSYGVARIERVTAKMVYATANHRSQFSHGQVLPMASEADAKRLVERITSAEVECDRRVKAARASMVDTIDGLISRARGEAQ